MQASNQIAIILASITDEHEITALTQQIYEISENIVGGRISHTYYSEIKYFASTLYILLTSISGNTTIGQDFCGLKMYQKHTTANNDISSNAFDTSYFSNSSLNDIFRNNQSSINNIKNKISFQSLRYETCLKYSLLYGLTAYVGNRLDTILPVCSYIINILVAPDETVSQTVTTAVTTTATQLSPTIPPTLSSIATFSTSADTTTGSATPPLFTASILLTMFQNYIFQFDYTKYYTIFTQALFFLYHSWGDNTLLRGQYLYSILSACHDLLFYMSVGHNRFPTLMTRLCDIHHLTNNSNNSGYNGLQPPSSVSRSDSSMKVGNKNYYCILAAISFVSDRKTRVLVWLLMLKLGFQGLCAFRIFIQKFILNWRRYNNINNNNILDSNSHNNGKSDNNVNISSINTSPATAAIANPPPISTIVTSTKLCELCREYLKSPTCCPCGHVYCWQCLMDIAAHAQSSVVIESSVSRNGIDNNNNINSNVIDDDGCLTTACLIKCPLCRYQFPIQKIRVLHGY